MHCQLQYTLAHVTNARGGGREGRRRAFVIPFVMKDDLAMKIEIQIRLHIFY